jgi:hypothetical protein
MNFRAAEFAQVRLMDVGLLLLVTKVGTPFLEMSLNPICPHDLISNLDGW